MGILNVTPDSFSDGGEYNTLERAVAHAKQMIVDGADIIDVGGESSRPGAKQITTDEEINRVIPVIKALKKEFDDSIIISIDSYKSVVVDQAIKAGATIVNSMGGFSFDAEIAEIVAKAGTKLIIYHIKGEPQTMQKGEIHYENVIDDINKFFSEQIEIAEHAGIKKDALILDPGFGFGKTVDQNLEIIKRCNEFAKHTLPILIGVSRKSTIGTLIKNAYSLERAPEPKDRLAGSLALTAFAVQNGATIVRTHDVKETKQFLTVLSAV